jgi:hypothetical protein
VRIDTDLAFSACLACCSLASLITSAELHSAFPSIKPAFSNILRTGKSCWVAIWVIRINILTALFTLIACASGYFMFYVAPFILLSRVLLLIVREIGTDGSDQIQSLILISLAVGNLTGCEEASLFFVAAQVTICYFISGLAKWLSPVWRSGSAFTSILESNTYGHPHMATLFKRYAMIGRAANYAPMLMLTLFPFLLTVPNRCFVVACLAMMLSFHFGCALLMGLNNFLFSFPSSYWAFIWLHERIHHT